MLRRKDGSTANHDLGALTGIGRGAGNDVTLDDPRVSRHHAVIRLYEDGRYVITDLGSANGTFLNDRRVLVPEHLTHGDVIVVGSSRCTFEHADSARRDKPLADGDDATASERDAFEAVKVLGASPAMLAVFVLMRKATATSIPVLISGETGTGKEVVARAIHAGSARRSARFLAVNCAAVPETLLESQLFGHRRGAFTDAKQDQVGLFEAAQGGTILLDEIGEMPPGMQAKLLRVLEAREVTPLGETNPRKIDVRILSATNRDLEKHIEAKLFRADLYYRLATFPIELPALRDRREDIPLLADRFVSLAAARHRKSIAGIDAGAMECLRGYQWPGNVRELQNEIQRAVVLTGDGAWISPVQLSDRVRSCVGPDGLRSAPSGALDGAPGSSLMEARADFEARHIARVLEEQGGNVSRAAAALGMSRVGLHRKLKEYGLR